MISPSMTLENAIDLGRDPTEMESMGTGAALQALVAKERRTIGGFDVVS
jgi:hypothetical protein